MTQDKGYRASLNGQQVYFMGNKAQLTGEWENLYGNVFYSAVLLEGVSTGDIISIAASLIREANRLEPA